MADHFYAKKSLGQHFLTSAVVPGWLCDAASIEIGDSVVEIGPGKGILTKELLRRGAIVYALEADMRAITVLQETCATEIENKQLTVVHTDVRDFDITTLPFEDHLFKVVSNIPYYLSGMLFRSFLAGIIQPNTLVYLVQKEVAKRITTSLDRGEKESLLSLSVKLFGEVHYVRSVSKGHFTPPPKVDSGIVAVRNINRETLTSISQDFFFKILHLGFGKKRKQLLGNLASQYSRESLTNIFSTCDILPTARAEDIPLSKWLILVTILGSTDSL